MNQEWLASDRRGVLIGSHGQQTPPPESLTNNGFDKAVTPGWEAAEFPKASGSETLQLPVSEAELQVNYIVARDSDRIAISEGASTTRKAMAEAKLLAIGMPGLIEAE